LAEYWPIGVFRCISLHLDSSGFLWLGGKPRALSFCVDFALANDREPEGRRSLADPAGGQPRWTALCR